MKAITLSILACVAAGAGFAAEPRAAGIATLEGALLQEAAGLNPEALHAALASWDSLRARGEVTHPVLSVIDYGLPSTAKRLWVFDIASGRLIHNELVAHGRNSGEDVALAFSNEEGSFMTSLGAFVTGAAYDGKNGYSLRLRGTEPTLNDRAEARAIVLHGAPYVDETFAQEHGRLGRSHGCPAVRLEVARELIDEIKDGSVIYAWHPSLASAGSRTP